MKGVATLKMLKKMKQLQNGVVDLSLNLCCAFRLCFSGGLYNFQMIRKSVIFKLYQTEIPLISTNLTLDNEHDKDTKFFPRQQVPTMLAPK